MQADPNILERIRDYYARAQTADLRGVMARIDKYFTSGVYGASQENFELWALQYNLAEEELIKRGDL